MEDSREGEREGKNKESGSRGLLQKEGGSGEGVSGGGGSLDGEKGQLYRGKNEHVEGVDVGVLAEAASFVASLGKEISSECVSKTPKLCHQAR